MIVPLHAVLEPGMGTDIGVRRRPRVDRWRLDLADVEAARGAGELPLGHVPGGESDALPVLVTMDVDEVGPWVGAHYVTAVHDAGGLPLLLPPGPADVDALLDRVGAVVITGGAFDIHPAFYGQEVRGRLDHVDAARTTLELDLARAALARGVPVFGVCGGMQALNVAAGGTLVQDLPAEPTHEQPTDPAESWHDVWLQQPLTAWMGSDVVAVNSTHHQAVDHPGDGFLVRGRSPDGVVEAIVHHGHPFAVGVQWHPERLGDTRLYAALVEAGRAYLAGSAGASTGTSPSAGASSTST